jgi:hypothetical protein
MNSSLYVSNGGLPIPFRLFDKAFPLGFGCLPDNFPRNAHNNRMGGNHLPLPDKSPCGNEAPRANFSPREENGINPDETAIPNGTRMDHRHMPNDHITSDREIHPRITMKDRSILNVGVLADRDPGHVSPNDNVVPDRNSLREYDITYNGCILSKIGTLFLDQLHQNFLRKSGLRPTRLSPNESGGFSPSISRAAAMKADHPPGVIMEMDVAQKCETRRTCIFRIYTHLMILPR